MQPTPTRTRASASRPARRTRLHYLWDVFADTFPAQPFLTGERLGALDLLAAVVSKWSGSRKHLAASRPAFSALLARIEGDPRVAPVFARHWPPAPDRTVNAMRAMSASSSALAALLAHPAIWRGDDCAPEPAAVPSGFAALDAALPGRGWPQGALTELLLEREGIGEIRLTLPALAHVQAQRRDVVWIAPPYRPYAPALAAAGLDLARFSSCACKAPKDALWAFEQALRAPECGAAFAWLPTHDERALRRLQVAARDGRTWGVLWRRPGQRGSATAAPLRLALAPTGWPARRARAEAPRRGVAAAGADRCRSAAFRQRAHRQPRRAAPRAAPTVASARNEHRPPVDRAAGPLVDADSHFASGRARHASLTLISSRKVAAMSSLAHHFYTMAANNAWANHRLLAACARLSQQDFAATRTSFFPSLKATLNHIVTVDWYYVDALERALRGQPANTDAGRFFDPEEPFATCAEIVAAQHAVDPAAARRLPRPDRRADGHARRRGRAARASNTKAPRACSRICSSTRSTIAGRRTRCSPARRSRRRSSTNSSARTKRTCAPRSWPRSGCRRKSSGEARALQPEGLDSLHLPAP